MIVLKMYQGCLENEEELGMNREQRTQDGKEMEKRKKIKRKIYWSRGQKE
jgi:hypothetical protein